jgi:hypothetical protein
MEGSEGNSLFVIDRSMQLRKLESGRYSEEKRTMGAAYE